MPPPVLFYRGPVAREEPFNIEQCEAFKRPLEFCPAPAREIVAPERPVSKYGIAAEEELLFFAEQADASRCVTRRMDDDKVTDGVTLFERYVRQYAGRTGAKVHREALRIVQQSPDIVLVDRNFGFAHVRDLFYPGSVVEMAMGENNGLDPLLVRCYCHGQDPGIHEDISHDKGISPPVSIRYPLDLHAQ